MKFRKYIKYPIILFILITLTCIAHVHAKESKKKFLNISTGSITGIYYPIGSTMCRIFAPLHDGAKKYYQEIGSPK